ncbi:hypothetical protein ALC57_00446 [Trachymyrmex cornetzi]|uniref:Uncharacterized protein n=1 Tax=Trachymyrmex cornetzi TaxID=471704 RepID=A0A151JS54_9HYME|nr:hypothetical protein ALC57_00446 [Trachymyrmex cornetzi]
MKNMKIFLFVFGMMLFLGIIIPSESIIQYEDFLSHPPKSVEDWIIATILSKIFTKTYGLNHIYK